MSVISYNDFATVLQSVRKCIDAVHDSLGARITETESSEAISAAALADLNERLEELAEYDSKTVGEIIAATLADLNERLEALEDGGGSTLLLELQSQLEIIDDVSSKAIVNLNTQINLVNEVLSKAIVRLNTQVEEIRVSVSSPRITLSCRGDSIVAVPGHVTHVTLTDTGNLVQMNMLSALPQVIDNFPASVKSVQIPLGSEAAYLNDAAWESFFRTGAYGGGSAREYERRFRRLHHIDSYDLTSPGYDGLAVCHLSGDTLYIADNSNVCSTILFYNYYITTSELGGVKPTSVVCRHADGERRHTVDYADGDAFVVVSPDHVAYGCEEITSRGFCWELEDGTLSVLGQNFERSLWTGEKYDRVVIPSTCQALGDCLFSAGANIDYEGTKAEFGNIQDKRRFIFDADSSAPCMVHCTDGDIILGSEYIYSYMHEGKECNGFAHVDLGLPSGRLWATCNVGANSPEEYGFYFQWGDSQGYKDNESGKVFDWESYKWSLDSAGTYTKYNTSSYHGIVDNLTELELEDDAAYVSMGGDWRMPSSSDFRELIAGTTQEWTTLNGINGCLFTSKTNGNVLFFPSAGYCSGSKNPGRGSTDCQVWSRSLDTGWPVTAYYLSCDSSREIVASGLYRYHGFSVRGVL